MPHLSRVHAALRCPFGNRTLLLAALAATTTLGACRNVATELGPTQAAARTNADALFAALAARFDNVQRSSKFAHARTRLSRHALSPSGIYDDSSVWTSVGADSARVLTLAGGSSTAGYAFIAGVSAPTPDVVGESRHVIRLRRLGESEYVWTTDVDHAIGPVGATDVASAIVALLAAPEGRTESKIRAEYRTAFPRTTKALGELFTLDTLRAVPLPDRTTSVRVRFTMHPARIRATRPNFAKYLEKYVTPARYDATLRDDAGRVWLETSARDNRFDFSYRLHEGRLVTLAGPPRPMPDSVQLHAELSAKFMIFRVGVSKLVADFVVARAANERAWVMRFRQEPEWHFPLAVNNLIRTALRRPFAGDGITFRVGVRDSPGVQSLLVRRARVAVQEGAIVRWLGGLGNSAMSDFAGKAEAEENRYLHEVLSALRTDFVTVLGGGE